MKRNKEKIWVCHAVLSESRRVSSIFQLLLLTSGKKKKKVLLRARLHLEISLPNEQDLLWNLLWTSESCQKVS